MKRILLTNDDGYVGQGLRQVYEILRDFYDITVVAPQSEQSGIGHAFTFNGPLRYRRIEDPELPCYAVSGTPSDCVKFAVAHLLADQPDLVVSGINIGENSGTAGYYSGTVAAAREGAFWKIPSIAFSMCAEGMAHIPEYAPVIREIIATTLEHHAVASASNSAAMYLNVNFPACRLQQSKGIKVTRQSLAFFDDRYREVVAEDGSREYWLYGSRMDLESSDQYDTPALYNGYITVTPLSYDATDTAVLQRLTGFEQVKQ